MSFSFSLRQSAALFSACFKSSSKASFFSCRLRIFSSMAFLASDREVSAPLSEACTRSASSRSCTCRPAISSLFFKIASFSSPLSSSSFSSSFSSSSMRFLSASAFASSASHFPKAFSRNSSSKATLLSLSPKSSPAIASNASFCSFKRSFRWPAFSLRRTVSPSASARSFFSLSSSSFKGAFS